MKGLGGKKIAKSLRDKFVHFIPAVVSIFLFQVVAVQIYYYNPIKQSAINFIIWTMAQACGAYFWGVISDKICRRTILVTTQCLGCLCMPWLISSDYRSIYSILLTGLFFGPTPVARAALIDNFPNTSKVRIIGITFISLLIPWALFQWIVSVELFTLNATVIVVLAVNAIYSILWFEDRRDKRSNTGPLKFVIKHSKNRKLFVDDKEHHKKRSTIFIGLALIPAQAVFFLSDSFFEEVANNAPFFTMLGWGVLIGAVASVFYNKLPHISVITFCYVIGFIFCMQGFVGSFVLSLSKDLLSVLILLFSTLGGFYLPFIYDAILRSVHFEFWGGTCGTIEGLISVSSVLGLAIIIATRPNTQTILMLMTLFFLLAAFLQGKAERKRRTIKKTT